ncbi:hypothetical protein [Streptacidiphilus cavernicola]|uniref:Uncharacterized protein n=1 Tax=Streptacidiphilus cavernicola TaxID=3342716 RepID=A0ABV6VXT8_9ACTN
MTPRVPRPGDVRCGGVYGEKYRQRPELIGTQCTQMVDPSIGFCGMHKEIPEDRRCKGRGRPHWAMKGQALCGIHGGKNPRNRAAAERRLQEARVAKLAQTYGLKIETTATDALLDEVQWTAGHVAWLRERVQEIEEYSSNSDSENPLVWGVTRRKEGGEDRGTTEEAGPNVWIKLYQQERQHLVRVCSEAIRAGIEERRVKLAEAQGALVVKAINAILNDLDLSAEQAAKISDVVPRHLRALSA